MFYRKIKSFSNSLNGLDPNIKINISDNEQISNIIIICKNRYSPSEYTVEAHIQEVKKELQARNYNQETIDQWTSYIC